MVDALFASPSLDGPLHYQKPEMLLQGSLSSQPRPERQPPSTPATAPS